MNTKLRKTFPFLYALCFSYATLMIFLLPSVKLAVFSFLMSLCALFINKKYISGQMIYSTKDFVNLKTLQSNFFIVAGKKIKKLIMDNEEIQLSQYTSIDVNKARILSICTFAAIFYFIFNVTKIIQYERVAGGVFFICIVLTIISMNINFYMFPLFVQLLTIVFKLSFYGQKALGPNALIYELIYIALLFLIIILIHNLSEENQVVNDKEKQNLQITKILKSHLEVFIPFVLVLFLVYLAGKDLYSFNKRQLPYKHSSKSGREVGRGDLKKAAEEQMYKHNLKIQKKLALEKKQEKEKRKQKVQELKIKQEKLKKRLEETKQKQKKLKTKQEKIEKRLKKINQKQKTPPNNKEIERRKQLQNKLKALQNSLNRELEVNKKSEKMIKKKIENNEKKLEDFRKKQIQEDLEERKKNEYKKTKESEAKNNKQEKDQDQNNPIEKAINKINSAQNKILNNENYISNKDKIKKLLWGILLLLILLIILCIYRYIKKRLKTKGMTIDEILNYNALEILKRDVRKIIRKRMRPEKEVIKIYTKYYTYVQDNIYMNKDIAPPPTILAKNIWKDFPQVKEPLLTISNIFCNVKYGSKKIKKGDRNLFRDNMNHFIEFMYDLNVNSKHDNVLNKYGTREVESIKRSKNFIEL